MGWKINFDGLTIRHIPCSDHLIDFATILLIKQTAAASKPFKGADN
jgi:hypothetical protein